MEKAKIILGVLWGVLLKSLKNKLVKALVFKIVGSLTGPWAFLVSFILEFAWDKVGVPLCNLAKRKGLLVYDKTQGAIQVKKLKEAKENNDEDSYNNIVDNI